MRNSFLSLLMLLLLPLHAAAETVGMPFLRLNAGARGAALAEAVTALPDAEAASANPAALRADGRRTFAFTHAAWIQSIRHDYLSALFAGERSTWAVTAQLSQADDLERRTGPTTDPLGHFGVYDGAVGLSYARAWTTRLRLGGTVRLIRQAIATRTATGAALDLGALRSLGDHLHLGLAVLRNLGGMSALGEEATSLPRSGRLGLSYTGFSHLLVSGEIQRAQGSATSLHLGAEWTATRRLTLRGGYQTTDSRHLSAGLGLKTDRWSVDYAFIPFDSGLGEAHRLSLQLHRR
jgi:hypothetical protein